MISKLGLVSESWQATLAAYQAKTISREDLYPAWLAEVQRLMRVSISPDCERQAIPLFDNTWGPQDATEHLLLVWALKGWLVNDHRV